jgi:hypothetical protein
MESRRGSPAVTAVLWLLIAVYAVVSPIADAFPHLISPGG